MSASSGAAIRLCVEGARGHARMSVVLWARMSAKGVRPGRVCAAGTDLRSEIWTRMPRAWQRVEMVVPGLGSVGGCSLPVWFGVTFQFFLSVGNHVYFGERDADAIRR